MTTPAHVDDPRYWPYCLGNGPRTMVAPGRMERRPVTLVGTIGERASLVVGDEPPDPVALARSQWVAMWPSEAEADEAASRLLRSMPENRLPFDAWDVLKGFEPTAGYYRWLIRREVTARVFSSTRRDSSGATMT